MKALTIAEIEDRIRHNQPWFAAPPGWVELSPDAVIEPADVFLALSGAYLAATSLPNRIGETVKAGCTYRLAQEAGWIRRTNDDPYAVHRKKLEALGIEPEVKA